MRELNGMTAVVTGAASGMGRTSADRCAQAGMEVVLADIEEQAIERRRSIVATPHVGRRFAR